MASVKIIDKPKHLASVKNINHRKFHIKKSAHKVEITYKLPFRIKFTNVQVPGYGPTNVPPIGIAIIGINDYIL